MGLKWDTDHMKKGFYIDENGDVLEVKNVYDADCKIDNSIIKIGNEIRLIDDFKNYFDYNTSFDDIQFQGYQSDIDNKMEKVIEELANLKYIDTSYYSKKVLKSGEKKSYFYNRKTELKETFFFYHNNVRTHPHIHIHLPKNIPLGKNCYKLKKTINSIFEKYKLIPNSEIIVEKNNTKEGKYEIRKFQGIKKTLEKVSWLYRQAESKVVNENKSVREYLDSKIKILIGKEGKEYKIYATNHCYFSLENSDFYIRKKMIRGKNKGETEKIKVHSLNVLINNYSKYSKIAGSKDFLESLINRIEKSEKIIINKSCLEQYEKINFENGKEVLQNLTKKIDNGEKISSSYKDYWRKNINSDNSEKKEISKAIQELYAERKNNVFQYSKEKLIEKYEKGIENIEIIGRNKMILEKLDEFLEFETLSDRNLINKIKNENRSLIIYLEKYGNKQYLIINKDKIDISQILKKYGVKTIYGKIKENIIKKEFGEIEEIKIENKNIDKEIDKNNVNQAFEITVKISLEFFLKEVKDNKIELEEYKDIKDKIIEEFEDIKPNTIMSLSKTKTFLGDFFYSIFEKTKRKGKEVLTLKSKFINFVSEELGKNYYFKIAINRYILKEIREKTRIEYVLEKRKERNEIDDYDSGNSEIY